MFDPSARSYLLLSLGMLLFTIGLISGLFIRTGNAPFLPTRIPATPVNYQAEIRATTTGFDFSPTPMPTLRGDLLDGQELYVMHCAHCHGLAGQGEPGNPNPDIPDAVGYLRVPRHDSLGRAWMYPDQLLIDAVKLGIMNPMARYQMPPFEGVITAEEIILILNYVKLWWTEDQREQQAAATERMRLAREDPHLLETLGQ